MEPEAGRWTTVKRSNTKELNLESEFGQIVHGEWKAVRNVLAGYSYFHKWPLCWGKTRISSGNE